MVEEEKKVEEIVNIEAEEEKLEEIVLKVEKEVQTEG